MNITNAAALIIATGIASASVPAQAQDALREIRIEAQDLGPALRALGRATGQQIIFAPGTVEGRRSIAVRGSLTVRQALDALLRDSGLVALERGRGYLVVGRSDPSIGDGEQGAGLSPAVDETITVTGSRVKGAPVASPVLVVSRDDIVTGGHADLGSALRNLPQNFAGGQNPGVGSGASAGGLANQNITGGSAPNLRGLGGDATLTLLDGNRMAYGGFTQGVDISSVPIDAVGRIDVVPDGASAIYGSDAVAGVVNVILREPFDGAAARARLGGATQGGDFEQQYSLTGGKTWSSGSALVAYEYRRNTAIHARQRDYTAALGTAPYMLYPELRTHSGLLRLKQDVNEAIHLSLVSQLNDRRSNREITSYGRLGVTRVHDRMVSLAPGIDVEIARDWTLAVRGVYSRDRAEMHSQQFTNGVRTSNSQVCYCNTLYSAEAYLEGTILALPGGDARLVAGGGHRSNRFRNANLLTGTGYAGSQQNSFGYGELAIPLVSSRNAVPLVQALHLNLAARYDRYNGFGSIVTPKVGVVYSPVSGLDLKASWGRSFKAPTLLQQLQARAATLIDGSLFTGSTAPAGSSVLYTDGGSRTIDAEKASSLSLTAAIRPDGAPGLSLDLTYFRLNYEGRVARPIPNFLAALNPVYTDFVDANPTRQQVEEAIASADSALQYFGNPSTDLNRVAFIIRNHFTNVAMQKVEGIDVNLAYRTDLGGGEVTTSLNGSWLASRQRSNSRSPSFELAGTIWNPARYRARATLGWEGSGLRVVGALNYTGTLEDQRAIPFRNVPSTVTADGFIGYQTGDAGGWMSHLEIGLSVSNLFDTDPPALRAAAFVEPYDSTNYSPVGRFVALSISKSF
ncbi:MAG: TonB-dependent receptor [Novosphingobium sp.]